MPNPILSKFGDAARQPASTPVELDALYARPAYTGPRPVARYLTLDDVVQRTGAMLAVLLAAGALSWAVVTNGNAGALVLVGAFGALGLGLYMAVTMRARAALCLPYAALQGVALGAISHLFNDRYAGIVIQALTGTVMVAAGMLFVYKIGVIRVTPRFTRVAVGAVIGVFGLMLVNGLVAIFHSGGLGLRSGGALAVVFSLVCIVVAAMNLAIDFELVEQGIRNGADARFAWYASFGIVATLVWLYVEILRLLGYLRD